MADTPTPPSAHDSLEHLAEEIAEARNLMHGVDGEGHPWSPSVLDSARRRLHYLRDARTDLVVGEIRKGHDPVDIAVRAHLDPADVARILAVRLRSSTESSDY